MQDYLHLCQVPFQAVMLKDSLAWLGLAHHNPNSQLGRVWDIGIWSRADNHASMAGMGYKPWDFIADDDATCVTSLSSSDDDGDVDPLKGGPGGGGGGQALNKGESGSKHGPNPLLGLTVHHKILWALTMHATYCNLVYLMLVPGFLSFLVLQFADIVWEEWDQSWIHNCPASMEHVQKLLC